MRTTTSTTTIAVTLALASCCYALAGCTGEPIARPSTGNECTGNLAASCERKADVPVASPVTPDEVIDPREKTGPIDATSYVATEGPFRLFGIEGGDGTAATARPSAIIADARGWTTRAYFEGEPVGRGLKVTHIDDASGTVTLHGAKGDVVLSTRANVELRIVRHKLDVVARPLGKNRWALDPAAARAAAAAHAGVPAFEKHELYGGPVLKLGPTPAGTLFAEADFREGDLIAAVDGSPVTDGAASLADIARALTDGRASFTVRVIRGGVSMDRAFTSTPQ